MRRLPIVLMPLVTACGLELPPPHYFTEPPYWNEDGLSCTLAPEVSLAEVPLDEPPGLLSAPGLNVEVASATASGASGAVELLRPGGDLELSIFAHRGWRVTVFVDGRQADLEGTATALLSTGDRMQLRVRDLLPTGASLVSVVTWRQGASGASSGLSFLAVRDERRFTDEIPTLISDSTDGTRMLLRPDGAELRGGIQPFDGKVAVRPCAGDPGDPEMACPPQDHLVVALADGNQMPIDGLGPAVRFQTAIGAITETDVSFLTPDPAGQEVVVLQLPGYRHSLADADGRSAWAQPPAEIGRFTLSP